MKHLTAGLLTLAACLSGPPLAAVTLTVTTTADDDGPCLPADCALREAILAANAAPGADVIVVPAGIYALSLAGSQEDLAATGDLDILDDLEIQGAGQQATTVRGSFLDRVFDVDPAENGITVTIRDLTVAQGVSPMDEHGGGIYNRADLTLMNLILRDNTSSRRGGGIFSSSGTLEIFDSVLSLNEAAKQGAGIALDASTLLIEDSELFSNSSAAQSGGGISCESDCVATVLRTTVRDNSAPGIGGYYQIGGQALLEQVTISGNEGGIATIGVDLTVRESWIDGNSGSGLAVNSGVALIERSTVSRNAAGGGIRIFSSTLRLVNSTVSGNRGFRGGGIYAFGPSDVTLESSTVVRNQATDEGAAVYGASESTVIFTNMLVEGDCDGLGSRLSNGGNLESPGDTCGFDAPSDQLNVPHPSVGPLGDHGGENPTHLPIVGSLLIDGGAPDLALCPATDQRGQARPEDGDGVGGPRCDVGAVEVLFGESLPEFFFYDGFESGDLSAW